MSEAEPYFTTYGELVEGQKYRFNVDNSWSTRAIGLTIAAGRAVQALPLPPKPVMVEVEAGLLQRLAWDAAECNRHSTPYERTRLFVSIRDARNAIDAAREAAS